MRKSKKKPRPLSTQLVWKEASPAHPWRCKIGQMIFGTFVNLTKKVGRYGEYSAVVIDVLEDHFPKSNDEGYTIVEKQPSERRTVSGSMIVNMIDSSHVQFGDHVMIRFIGYEDLSDERTMKEFRLWTSR